MGKDRATEQKTNTKTHLTIIIIIIIADERIADGSFDRDDGFLRDDLDVLECLRAASTALTDRTPSRPLNLSLIHSFNKVGQLRRGHH